MYNWQKILVAVNDSNDSALALNYVGQLAESVNQIFIFLIYVFPDPPPDFYHKGGTLEAYREIMLHQGEKVMELAVKTLGKYGVDQSNISTKTRLAEGKSISQVILDEREEHDISTLVVGKRGISKNEEFLYGSISNTLARKSKGFTTWVVG